MHHCNVSAIHKETLMHTCAFKLGWALIFIVYFGLCFFERSHFADTMVLINSNGMFLFTHNFHEPTV